MKLLLVSDLAGKVPEIPKEDLASIDVVLIAGDLTIGAKSEKSIGRVFKKAAKVFPPPLQVYFVPGNHDNPKLATSGQWVPENFHLVHDKIIEISNEEELPILLVGFGGAKLGLYNNFAFHEDEIQESLDALFQQVGKDYGSRDFIRILLVHDPPSNTNLDFNHWESHVGSISVRKIIETYQPDLAVAGHIHESKGRDAIGQTVCVNAGEAKYGNYAVIEVSNWNIEVKFNQIAKKRKQ